MLWGEQELVSSPSQELVQLIPFPQPNQNQRFEKLKEGLKKHKYRHHQIRPTWTNTSLVFLCPSGNVYSRIFHSFL